MRNTGCVIILSDNKFMDKWTATRTILEKNPGIKRKELLPKVMKLTDKGKSVITDAFSRFEYRGKIFREKGRYYLEEPIRDTQFLYEIATKDPSFLKFLDEKKSTRGKISKMFRTSNSSNLALEFKENRKLTVEQYLILTFHIRIGFYLDIARRIMNIKNASLSPRRTSECIAYWKNLAKESIGEALVEDFEYIAKRGKEDWERLFGSLERDQLPLLRGLIELEKKLQDIQKKKKEKEKAEEKKCVEISVNLPKF